MTCCATVAQVDMSMAALVQRLQWHYTIQLLTSVYKLVGSLDFIGNPAAVFSDVRGGFKVGLRL